MFKIRRTACFAAIAALAAVALPAHADGATDELLPSAQAAAPSGLTREQVREELRLAKANGTMSPGGELGDTPEVLAARDIVNAAQTEAYALAWNEHYAREAAVLAAIEAEREALQAEMGVMAMSLPLEPGDDEMQGYEVRIEFIGLDAQ